MFHYIRSLTCGTVNWFYHHHRPAFPRRDMHDTAAPLVRIYQGGSRNSTNLGHYPSIVIGSDTGRMVCSVCRTSLSHRSRGRGPGAR
jgi:hypothetical protein